MTKKILVQYFQDGLRAGYLVKAGRKWTRVERILPKGSKMRRIVRVPATDVVVGCSRQGCSWETIQNSVNIARKLRELNRRKENKNGRRS